MSIGRILFLAVFLFSSSTILATSSLLEKMTYDSISEFNLQANSQAQVLKQQLREDYKKELLKLLNQYPGDNISFSNLEGSLLAMTVPAEYRDLHFKLVTAIAELNSQSTDLMDVRGKLEALRDAYSWLATNLAIFIVNNF